MEKIEIDFKELDAILEVHCTLLECAAFFNCSIDTIERRVKQERGMSFAEYSAFKRGAGNISLRRLQRRTAEKNPQMQIWLGKNWLGQSDKTDNSVTIIEDESMVQEIVRQLKGLTDAGSPSSDSD